jgi:RND family efflux transporter MFP subunit
MTRPRRYTLPLLVPAIVVVAALTWVGIAFGGWLDPGGPRWEAVVDEPLVRRISAGGELRSADSAQVGCPPIQRKWQFRIKFLAPEGSEVRAGEPVVAFDAKDLDEQLQVVFSQLNTAQSRLEQTRFQQREQRERLILERAEAVAVAARLDQKLTVPENLEARNELAKLRLDKVLADDTLRLIDLRIQASRDNEQALIRTAENRVAQLEREVSEMEAAIAAHTVPAPRDGFVVHQSNWRGEKPKIGESIYIGQKVLEIADLGRMEIVAEVAEPDARWVQAGQRVEVRLDASPERVYGGEIRELGRLFRVKSAEVPKMVFDVTILLDDPDPKLMRPGMAASVEILAPTDHSVIQIPENAIRLERGRPVVTARRSSGKLETVAVELGSRWEGRVVVLDGLAVGDRIAIDADAS